MVRLVPMWTTFWWLEMRRARSGVTFWKSSMARSNGHHGNAHLWTIVEFGWNKMPTTPGIWVNLSSAKDSIKWLKMDKGKTWLPMRCTSAEQFWALRNGGAIRRRPNMPPSWATFKAFYLAEIAQPSRTSTSLCARSTTRRMRRCLCMTSRLRMTTTSSLWAGVTQRWRTESTSHRREDLWLVLHTARCWMVCRALSAWWAGAPTSSAEFAGQAWPQKPKRWLNAKLNFFLSELYGKNFKELSWIWRIHGTPPRRLLACWWWTQRRSTTRCDSRTCRTCRRRRSTPRWRSWAYPSTWWSRRRSCDGATPTSSFLMAWQRSLRLRKFPNLSETDRDGICFLMKALQRQRNWKPPRRWEICPK